MSPPIGTIYLILSSQLMRNIGSLPRKNHRVTDQLIPDVDSGPMTTLRITRQNQTMQKLVGRTGQT